MAVGRVLVDSRDGGSGFALAPQVVVTANHVVRGHKAQSLTFSLPGGLRVGVEQMDGDPTLDVAVLRLVGAVPEVLAVGQPAEGARWRVETQPRGSDPVLTGTIDATRRRLVNAQGYEVEVLQLRVDQQLGDYRGYSGGAVTALRPRGAVVGVLVEQLNWRLRGPPGRLQPVANVLYAIPIQQVLARFGLTGISVARPVPASRIRKTLSGSQAAQNRAEASVRGALVRNATAVNTLPRDIADFTGREPELRRLLDGIGQGRHTAVAIHAIDGMAGIGKTALAVHAAHRLAASYPDAQLFLDLRGYTPGRQPMHAEEALEILLDALGVPKDAPDPDMKQIPTSLEKQESKWRAETSQRRVVIVLDNAADPDQVLPLLPAAPTCLAIVTSRRRMAIENLEPLSLDTMPTRDAVALFTQIVGPERTDGEAAAVAEVVAQCGHLPLAIEVAAGWLRHRPSKTVADLLPALDAPLDAVTAALQLSYRGLDVTARGMLRRLGLHPGPDITAEIAAALGDVSLTRARAALDNLYEHNLLQEPGRNRYRFHDLVRAFAHDLAEGEDRSKDRLAATIRLLNHCLIGATVADRLLGPGSPSRGGREPLTAAVSVQSLTTDIQAVAWFDGELPNLLACTRRAAEMEITSYVWELPSAMETFLRVRGYTVQARPLHIEALNAATRLGDQLGQANAHTSLGTFYRVTGDWVAARGHLDQALDIYHNLGEQLGQANAHASIGMLDQLTGDYAQARSHLVEAMAAYTRLGNLAGEAMVHSELGSIDRLVGDYDRARGHAMEALARYTRLGNRMGQAEAQTDLGVINRLSGDYVAARTDLELALQLHTKLQDEGRRAYALIHLGALLQVTGDQAAARARLDEALDIYHGLGDRLGKAYAHTQLGILDRRQKEYVGARTHLEQALAIYARFGSMAGQANTENSLGVLDRLMGDRTAARMHLEHALSLYRTIGNRVGQVDAHKELAIVHRLSGEEGVARTHLESAVALSTDLGNARAQAETLVELGALHERAGERIDARRCWERALALYVQLDDPRAETLRTRLDEHR